MNNSPIGIFDSGVGGTSIWRELQRQLPFEDMIYLADSKNAPYGNQSKATIIDLSRKNTDWLLKQGCKLVVVACNTATTNAIDHLRQEYKIPFIGIEPAIKPAALQTDTKKVGVLATRGTLASQLFQTTSKNHASDIEVLVQQGDGLVALIEEGESDSEITRNLLKSYLEPMLAADIDHLVLGCTHYPYLMPVLNELLPGNITVIDCSEAVARQTTRVLQKENLLNQQERIGQHQFYTNVNKSILEGFLADSPVPVRIEQIDF